MALLCIILETPAAAKVLHSDKYGVRVEYTATDTGHSTSCSSSPASDGNYTTKKIKVWKVSLKITNGSGRRIRPEGPEIATMTVEPDQGSTLGYCSYERLPNLYKIDGRSDQSKLLFGIALGVRAIAPGRTLSNSTYLYLYEDQKPSLSHWQFDGYTFLEDQKKKAKKSQPAAKTISTTQKTAAALPSRQMPRPGRGGPSGSLLLLIDISGSMSGSKLSSAKRAAVDTIRKAIKSKTEIAVLAFEGDCTSPIHSL